MLIMVRTTILLAILLIVIPILQWKLSGTESRLPGLILPLMCFGYSLILALNYVGSDGQTLASAITAIAALLIMANLPTFALLAIYRNTRLRKKRKSAVDKMNIQDL